MQMKDALAARMEAVPFPGTADAGMSWSARSIGGSGLPADACAVICCPAPSVTRAAPRRVGGWMLEFEPRSRPFIDPLMGWTGSTDTLRQLKLRFPTREAAIDYARRQGLRYEVREPALLASDSSASTEQSESVFGQIPTEAAWAWEVPHLAFDRLFQADDITQAAA
jgi:ETC complex I subunit conserved region